MLVSASFQALALRGAYAHVEVDFWPGWRRTKCMLGEGRIIRLSKVVDAYWLPLVNFYFARPDF